MNTNRVLLVSLPWAPVHQPSAGLGVLKSVLRTRGIGCDIVEGSMLMLRYVKAKTYDTMMRFWGVNDFVFSGEFESDVSADQLEYLKRAFTDTHRRVAGAYIPHLPTDNLVDTTLRLRQEVVPRLFDDLMNDIDFSRYVLVGLTCMFDQTVASLAFARRIRRKYPDLLLAFGGYTLHPPVGQSLQKMFLEMDVVAHGDGEPVIVPLYEAAVGTRPLSDVPNITFRTITGEIVSSHKTSKICLDQSPAPDYDDFFRQHKQMGDVHGVHLAVGPLPVETSRGCWYGEKMHCTFCGIDDESLKYRRKSPEVLELQLDQLHRRYNVHSFIFTDYIMPREATKDFLPKMASRGAPYNFLYETKANLRDEDVSLAARAGIRQFQPGIESFSTPVLRLMRKGVRAMQNVQLLYSMARYGIYASYNILFGFPGEEPEHYRNMLALIPGMYHLMPPMQCGRVLITRNSMLQKHPEQFGIPRPVVAHYRHGGVFSKSFLDSHDLRNEDWCYYFSCDQYCSVPSDLQVFYDAMEHQVIFWKTRHFTGKPRLTFRRMEDSLVVNDARLSDDGVKHSFDAVHAMLSDFMPGRVWTRDKIAEIGAEHGFSATMISAAIDDLCDAKVVLHEGREYVWIAFDEAWEVRELDYTQDSMQPFCNSWAKDRTVYVPEDGQPWEE